MPALTETRAALIEQPFSVGERALLDGLQSLIPNAADQSVQGLSYIPGLVGRFSVANIWRWRRRFLVGTSATWWISMGLSF
jgi:hypothetical protein